MRHRFLLAALAAIGLAALVLPDQAYAQPRTSPAYSRPTFSPYLNLLRRGNSAALNYYGLVRPEQEFRADNIRLQNEITSQGKRFEQQMTEAELPATGHGAGFLTHKSYFMTQKGGTGSGSRPGAARATGGGGGTTGRTATAPSRPTAPGSRGR